MKMKKVSCLSVLILLLSLSVVASFPIKVLSKTELVSNIQSNACAFSTEYSYLTGYGVHNINTSLNYATIQEAINANETLSGHTILVDAGTYYENIVVNKSVSLIGEDSKTTVIDANETGNVIEVMANNVTIEGFTVQNGIAGIYIYYYNYIIIRNSNITANEHEGILLSHSSNNNMSGNNIANNAYGIYTVSSSNNSITGNNITENNYDGIWLDHSTNNSSITGNNITNNDYGIRLYLSSNNSINGNNMTANNLAGICLYLCSSNSINGNNITEDNYDGISLDSSSSNSMNGNNITNNLRGIYLSSSSNNNSVTGNNITNNDYGVYLYFSSSNRIFYNSFINNSIQVFSDQLMNVWDDDYPSGGNYWSDYTGVDSNQDGISDTEHTIDANNTDRYPLMGMFSNLNATSQYSVQMICNSSVFGFQFNGTAIIFKVTGENGSAGFCRVCIPRALMNDTYRVFVNGTEILPPPSPLLCSNSTHAYLYFNYTLSTKEVVIVPEFPSIIILPSFIMATLLALLLYKRKFPLEKS